ncbi:rhodanese-related sulfurtransferase [Thiogranum longum]|uniref:Rhodanese-related sulfurtransferase n=1 Tax=Thiogranum longum TaxID=1537524 RepID=A0A4R1HMP6_9GAMM|nr:rhodanese-like domain-containing protein [Thiogranum longum]TCK18522.1 rhodanese-related sulfurtransferase [Thiogranum longum]
MKTYEQLVNEALEHVEEIFPWDLAEILEQDQGLMLLDVREPYEFDAMHIQGALNVPRGILETACEYNYEETVPELVTAREREIIVICRSGKRSVLVADVMQQLGYRNVKSLKTGMRGWSDDDQEMVDSDGKPVDEDSAIEYFTPRLRPEQMGQ